MAASLHDSFFLTSQFAVSRRVRNGLQGERERILHPGVVKGLSTAKVQGPHHYCQAGLSESFSLGLNQSTVYTCIYNHIST